MNTTISTTKMQELAESYDRNVKESAVYMENLHLFAGEMQRRLMGYLGCQPGHLKFINADNKIVGRATGAAQINEQGLFEFRFLLSIPGEPVNINDYGSYLFNQGLSPASGVILRIDMIQSEGGYKVIAPSPPTQTGAAPEFVLNAQNEDNWNDFLDICWQSAKYLVNASIADRLSHFTKKHSDEERVFGFRF